MRPPGYPYQGGMPGQQRAHMGMPQGPMSPVMSGVGSMQPPQVLICPISKQLF